MALGFGFDLMSQAVRQRPWTPRFLFGDGEEGAWYDPSDFATLYQDSAGTTPVTALGQPVGLMIDKSKGGKPTQELVDLNSLPTPTISNAGGSTGVWDAATRTMSNTVIGTNNSFPRFDFDFGLAAGARYAVSGRLSGDLTSVALIRLSSSGFGNNVSYSSATGVFAAVQLAAYDSLQFLFDGTQLADVTIEELSIREIPGNHAAQATTAAMPYVQARVNLLEDTESFGVYYAKSGTTVSANTTETLAPNGTQTATKLLETATTGEHIIFKTTNIFGEFSFSVFAKAAERSFLHFGDANDRVVTANLSTGQITAEVGTTTNRTMTNVGNGWWRISFSANNRNNWRIYVSADGVWANRSYSGDNTKGIYIWGAQLEVGSTATTYQRVTTATDYADIGLPRYLEFDGVDDALSTASIDFTSTDEVTVCVGVESAFGSLQTIVESSVVSGTNPGSFALFRLLSPTNGAYFSRSYGTLNSTSTSAAYSGTDTAVVSVLGEVSSDTNIIRRNAAQIATSATDQGTGNYGDYPLYIGARNDGAAFELNGRIHQLIIRGKTTAGNLLDQTERFVARKTGVTL